jgi:LysM repeat protein
MSKRTYAIILVILVAGLLLSACERPASVAPVTSPTQNGEIPFPVATQPQIMKDILAATQTAAALLGTPSSSSGATSTPGFTYSTPDASGTLVTIPLVTSTPVPTAIVYATPTPGKPSQYTLQKGEFPYCIARRFNVSAADLLSINGLNTNSVVSVGTTLKIPQSGTWSTGPRALKTHPASYTIAYGDTLSSIACGFGDADPNTIQAANGLAAGAVLKQGQVLQIP